MRKLLSSLINSGVETVVSNELAKRVRHTNILALAIGLFCLAFAVMYYSLGLKVLGHGAAFFALSFFTVMVLNRFRFYNLSRGTLIFAGTASICSYVVILGQKVDIHYWFIATVSAPFLIYELSERKQLVAASLLSIAAVLFFKLSEFYGVFVPLIAIGDDAALLISCVMVSSSLAFTLWIVYTLAHNYQAKMLKLDSERARVKSIIESTPAIFYTCRAGGDFAPSFVGENVSTFGFSPSEFTADPQFWLMRVHPEDRETARSCYEKTLARDRCQSEYRFIKPDQSVIWVQNTLTLIRDAHGEPREIFGFWRDISVRKDAEAAAAAALKMATLGEVSANIAHEINNPLAIISGLVRKVETRIKNGQASDPAATAAEFAKIDKTIQRIAKIINGLKAFARNDEDSQLEDHDLLGIIHDTAELASPHLAASGVELRLRVDIQQPVTIRCRPVQISQVVLNLLSNACDAIHCLDERWIELTVSLQASKVLVSVKDSGKGIPNEVARKIMEPFYTTKEPGKGTGLGLSLSKRIAEEHQGHLRYEGSGPNTLFVLELPVRRNEVLAPAAA